VTNANLAMPTFCIRSINSEQTYVMQTAECLWLMQWAWRCKLSKPWRRHSIMHLSLKPGNILMDSVQQEVVLSDFGTCHELQTLPT